LRRVTVLWRSVLYVLAGLAALAVEKFLVPSAIGLLIAPPAPSIGTLATVILPAAKGAAQVLAVCVTGMREEANPAVAAGHSAVSPTRTIAQDGI
jgi:hypothetical protein